MAQQRNLKLFNMIAGGIIVDSDPNQGNVKVAAHDGNYHEFSKRCYPVLANVPSAIAEVKQAINNLESALAREREAQEKLRRELNGIIGHQWMIADPKATTYTCSRCKAETDDPKGVTGECSDSPYHLNRVRLDAAIADRDLLERKLADLDGHIWQDAEDEGYLCERCGMKSEIKLYPGDASCPESPYRILVRKESAIGPALRDFAEACQRDLDDNDKKGSAKDEWGNTSLEYVRNRITKHATELSNLYEEVLAPIAGKPLPTNIVEQLRAPFIDVTVHLGNFTMMFYNIIMRRGGGPEAFIPSREPEMLKRFEGGYDEGKHFIEVADEIDEALGEKKDDSD